MKSHAQVVVVGGGMMGAGLLYHLAEAGWTDSVLVEKGELTSGSTWHAAGQCGYFAADYTLAKFNQYANWLYPRLEELTGQYVSWHGCGGIRLATSPEEVDLFKRVLGISRDIGYRMELVGPGEMREINPFLNPGDALLGAWTLDDGHVDPAGCCNALAAGARKMGAEVVRRNRVVDIKQRPGDEWEVFTEQGNIVCEHVVNAAGCYASEVGKMVGINVPYTNMKHQYLVTEPIEAFLERDEEMPIMRDPYTSGYYRQEQKSGLIGIYETGPAEAWAERGGIPDWSSESELFNPDLDRIAKWVERTFERLPIFAEAGIRRVVNGAITHSPDGKPFVGPAPGLRNHWLSCGAEIGIAWGAGCGKYLAQWMINGDCDLNMTAFDPRRFGSFADREYTRAKSFQDFSHLLAAHAPGEELPQGRPARTTPLYETLRRKGCVHTEAFGWERPKWFSPDAREETLGFRRSNAFDGVAEECRAVRERVGVMDLSSFAKFDVTGAHAERFLDRVFANHMPRKPGRMALAHRLSENGRIRSEATVTRLADECFYVLSGAAWEIRDFDALREQRLEAEEVEIRNVSDDFGVLVLAGPRSRQTLAKLTDADLGNGAFPWLTGKAISVAGIALRALRVNYVGELGWELHCPMPRLAELYDALWVAGEAFAITDFGAYAVNSLRMEKAYRAMGTELTHEVTLVEAGMERFADLRKEDFVGKAATERSIREPLSRRLVYFEVDAADADVMGTEIVYAGERRVGLTTSGGYGHASGKSLGFAYVERAVAEPGTRIEIDLLDDRRPATVLAAPVHDPANARLRA